MGKNSVKKILICEPQAVGLPFPYLPHKWAILKSSWEREGSNPELFSWIDPIFMPETAELMLQKGIDGKIDVLGLSCYSWNWNIQLSLAEAIKQHQSECLVVAGGPHPDHGDPHIFKKHPDIDIVVKREGERAFTNILEKVACGSNDFSSIPGLLIRGNNGEVINTGFPEISHSFSFSPYLDQSNHLERLIRQSDKEMFHAIIETNRGCPYSCNFCNWGASNNSRIRLFDLDRVLDELDFLARNRVTSFYFADSNFGMFERDVEIAEFIISLKEKYGYPLAVNYSAAKNLPDRLTHIARRFNEKKLISSYTLSLQHNMPEVLEIANRKGISYQKQMEVARVMNREGIPLSVELIFGMPGDSYELWKKSLSKLMEAGLHDQYLAHIYHLLPNTKAYSQKFRETWEIDSIWRFAPGASLTMARQSEDDHPHQSKSEMVVSTKTYSRADWIKMLQYTAFVQAVHNASLVRYIAQFMRHSMGVSFLDFYSIMFEQFIIKADPLYRWMEAIEHHYSNFLQNEHTIEYMPFPELPSYQELLQPRSWLVFKIVQNLDSFFDKLEIFLQKTWPFETHLHDLVVFQKEMILSPTYDRTRGKEFACEYDWQSYFQKVNHGETRITLEPPVAEPGLLYRVSDHMCGEQGFQTNPLDWENVEGEERWITWLNRTLMVRLSSAKNNFQDVKTIRK